MADPNGPGVIKGTENDDLIEVGFTDDDGDAVTNGGDVIFGLGGDDTVNGGEGDDTIHGDSGSEAETAHELFQWSDAPAFADGATAGTFTQDTGLAEITFSTLSQSGGVETEFETDHQNTDDLDADVDECSSLASVLNGDPNSAHYQWESDTALENVEFRINDIDGDGSVTVRAYDADGNMIEVQLTDAGSGVALTNTDGVAGSDTATSVDNDYTDPDAAEHSVLVTIPGPVVRWEVIHEQDGNNNSGINVTDISFDVTVSAGDLGSGNDIIFGDDGDDLIYGEGGSDTIYGGDDNDTIYGGYGGTGEITGRESFNWSEIDSTGTGTGGGTHGTGGGTHGTGGGTHGSGGGTHGSGNGTASGSGISDGEAIDPLYVQDTGSVTVTYREITNNGAETEFETDTQNVGGIDGGSETVDPNSALESQLNQNGENVTYKLDFSDPVANVDFRVNDIDHDSVVQILAYDIDGNLIPVTLTASGTTDLVLSDEDSVAGNDTATATDNSGSNDDDDNSILVEIAGPVSRIKIIHTQDGNDTSHVNVTDVFFDTLSTELPEDDGDDSLIGGFGDDEIYGQGGDDTIEGGDGSDTIEGGTGDDVIDSSSGNPLDQSPDLGFPSYMGFPAVPADTDPENDRDYVDGGAGDDVIVTGDDADTILGGSGNDIIDAGVDADVVDGGTGDDTIVGGEGSDTIDGGTGDDLIYGGLDPAYPDYLNIPDDGSSGDPDPVTNNGQDLIDGGAGNDTIYGQDDDDTIFGGDGNDVIDAGVDNDSVDGGAGIDIITGGQGNDTVSGGDDTDLVLGGEGDDVVAGNEGIDIVAGGEGDDTVSGGTETDFVFGGEGNDELSGDEGSDFVAGGDGDDLILGDGATDDGNVADGDADILVGGDGDDTILGGAGGDLIIGGDGADDMYGGDDDDVFFEVSAGDHVDGNETGDDYDTLVVSAGGVVEFDPTDPEAGTITHYDLDTMTVIGTSTFVNIENVIYVEDLQNPVHLFDHPDGSEDEAVVVALAASPVFVSSSVGVVDGTDLADIIDDTYTTDPEGDEVDGGNSTVPGAGPFDDEINGYDGDDIIGAGEGNDFVQGGDGNDIVAGGTGDDTLHGDDGNDSLFGDSGADELSGGIGDDLLDGGAGIDVLSGNEGDDSLLGGAGNDALYGGEGDDTLDGGSGQDLLIGGDGDDLMNFGDDGSGPDSGLQVGYGGDDQDTFVNAGDGTVIFGGEGGVDFDTLDLTGSIPAGGSYTITYNLLDPTYDPIAGTGESGVVNLFDSGGGAAGTISFGQIENIICFTPGTGILTTTGEVSVEQLKVGDTVVTRDNGLQTIRWVGAKKLSGRNLLARPNLRPVMIRKGSLGSNLPERDMMVSPNHRMLMVSEQAQLLFEETEVLVAAKHMTHIKGVHQVQAASVEYVHFLCDQHEVVLANGTWSESFQPGAHSMGSIGQEQRNEIYDLFPELSQTQGLDDYASARMTLKAHEARLIG